MLSLSKDKPIQLKPVYFYSRLNMLSLCVYYDLYGEHSLLEEVWSPVLQVWTLLLHYILITNYFFWVKSNLEISHTVILPPSVSVLCLVK